VIAGLVAAAMIAIAYNQRPAATVGVNDTLTSDAVVVETTVARYTRSGPASAWHMFRLPNGVHFKLLLAANLEPGDHVLVVYTRVDADDVKVHSLSRCGRNPCVPSGGAPPIVITSP
jgi:hypothetical protein